jgi:cytochrome bd-type quinol oxidase subunit 2
VSRRRLTDAVTWLAAQTFPPSRRADGRVVRDCARDAIDAAGLRAMARETLSVAFAGLQVRYAVSPRDVRQAPWRPALAALTLPLAAAFLCVWTFGFVPRYDHWPLGEGWVMLLGGSLLAVVGAALEARWVIFVSALAVFAAAGAPYVGRGTEAALNDTASFFPASGVDLGAASLLPALLLAGSALALPRGPERTARRVGDRLVLGLLPTGLALFHLLPRPTPERTMIFTHEAPPEGSRTLTDPTVSSGPPYPFPELQESAALLGVLGIALVVAAVLSWRAAARRPEAALATALVLVSVAYPVAWKLHGWAVWPHIVVPLGAAIALTLRAAHAAQRSSSARPASSSEPAASR